MPFTTIRTEGAILPPDLLRRVAAGDTELGGLAAGDYHLVAGERLNEVITRSWNRLTGAWADFRARAAQLPADDPATTLTRERWLLPLFQELGYGRLPTARAEEIEGRSYPISHRWQETPIHLVGGGVDLDRRSAGVAGASRTSPHGLVQEFLNRWGRSLWGFAANGMRLRVLRNSVSLTRQAYVEFDLEGMFDGAVYADFVLLWLVCHQSRVEIAEGRPEACWLERWSRNAQERGVRALDQLRGGVEEAIRVCGAGFLAHPANAALRERLRSGELDKQEYYRQLLRLVYRLLFLFVAEDRGLLLDPAADEAAKQRYLRYYSTARLRQLAGRRAGSRHADLFQALHLVMERLGDDAGCPPLALPALGSFLFSPAALTDLAGCEIGNRELLDAVRALAFTRTRGGLRAVDYRNLGAEEIGSVYESLLELHPEIDVSATHFELQTAAGNERKSAGAYYTPASLIQSLLDTALEPVLDEAARRPDAEAAILALRVCDPACGSGHFLIGAAHRIARRLAAVRTGDEEPSPEATRRGLRDVIGRCIHGVDMNPMAVELCKVALWLEALEPGRPLSFLDHRILTGNSLLGATPALIAAGLPDAAFEPIEGDDRRVAAGLKRRNREEQRGQGRLFSFDAGSGVLYGGADEGLAAVDAIGDETIAGVRAKGDRYARLGASPAYRGAHLLADAWCSAFVWKKTAAAPDALTTSTLRVLAQRPEALPAAVREEVERLARQYQFFHWHLAFPDVFRAPSAGKQPENEAAGWSGGFDVMLGNPPWERVKLQEQEWFAERDQEIAQARNAAERRRLIAELAGTNPSLGAAFSEARREAEGQSHLLRDSGRYPLCGRGDVNTYAVFAENFRTMLGPTGRAGIIVPSGIATDDTTKYFFAELVRQDSLVSLYSFFEIRLLFPATDSRNPFCLLTMSGLGWPARGGAEFAFFLLGTDELRDLERRFVLTADDIRLLNPNTRTCPIFRRERDAAITKAIYRRVPVLLEEGQQEKNPWGISFLRMLDMSNDSGLFRTREQLVEQGWRLEGNAFMRDGGRYLPLYEAKLLHQFDHRWATYDGLDTRDLTPDEKADTNCVVLPRYWVPAAEVERRLAGRWDRDWLLGWRDICRNTDERTVIAGMLPRAGVGHTCPLMTPAIDEVPLLSGLLANLSAYVLDFAARQKIGGTHLTYGYLNQLPILPPETYKHATPWQPNERLADWVAERVLELTYTAWDLQPFARDLGYDGPPFRWDEERRFVLRSELDAAYFHLYGLVRDEVDYILEQFPLLRRKDERRFGEYRTRRVIVERYDAMQRAIDGAEPYCTPLAPPPGDERAAHGGEQPRTSNPARSLCE